MAKRWNDMKRNRNSAAVPGLGRMLCAVALVLCVMAVVVWGISHYFPYDRLNHLYGFDLQEVIPVGYPGGMVEVYCDVIPGSPEIELFVDGEYYADLEYLRPGSYQVMLGADLFSKPAELKVRLQEKFLPMISLRSNTITLYVM